MRFLKPASSLAEPVLVVNLNSGTKSTWQRLEEIKSCCRVFNSTNMWSFSTACYSVFNCSVLQAFTSDTSHTGSRIIKDSFAVNSGSVCFSSTWNKAVQVQDRCHLRECGFSAETASNTVSVLFAGSHPHKETCPRCGAPTPTAESERRRTWTTRSCTGWAPACASSGGGEPQERHGAAEHTGSPHPAGSPPVELAGNSSQNRRLSPPVIRLISSSFVPWSH